MYPSPFLFASLVGRTAAFCSPAFIPNGLSVTARDALPFIVLKEASLRVQSGAMEHSPICLPSSIGSIDWSVLYARRQLRSTMQIAGRPVQSRARGAK